jgi:hypothetical protein
LLWLPLWLPLWPPATKLLRLPLMQRLVLLPLMLWRPL